MGIQCPSKNSQQDLGKIPQEFLTPCYILARSYQDFVGSYNLQDFGKKPCKILEHPVGSCEDFFTTVYDNTIMQ